MHLIRSDRRGGSQQSTDMETCLVAQRSPLGEVSAHRVRYLPGRSRHPNKKARLRGA